MIKIFIYSNYNNKEVTNFMEELNLNIENEYEEIISILLPAVTDINMLDKVKIAINEFCKNRYDELIYQGAYRYIAAY